MGGECWEKKGLWHGGGAGTAAVSVATYSSTAAGVAAAVGYCAPEHGESVSTRTAVCTGENRFEYWLRPETVFVAIDAETS